MMRRHESMPLTPEKFPASTATPDTGFRDRVTGPTRRRDASAIIALCVGQCRYECWLHRWLAQLAERPPEEREISVRFGDQRLG